MHVIRSCKMHACLYVLQQLAKSLFFFFYVFLLCFTVLFVCPGNAANMACADAWQLALQLTSPKAPDPRRGCCSI